jgi:hypothetical protein
MNAANAERETTRRIKPKKERVRQLYAREIVRRKRERKRQLALHRVRAE